MRYYEDFAVGEVIPLGDVTVLSDEVIAFGKAFDPQPFHTDPKAAEASPFGKLIASGWHTNALFMALLVQKMHDEKWAALGSPGILRCDWPRPVFAGDRLSAQSKVIEKRRSKSRRSRGFITMESRFNNQAGENVMRMRGVGIYGCRDTQTS